MKKEYRISDEKREVKFLTFSMLLSSILLLLFLGGIALTYSRLDVMFIAFLYPMLRCVDEIVHTFYPILERDMFIIRNLRVTSWGSQYKYSEIDEVCIKGGKGLIYPFLQVRLKNGKKSRNFSISALVDPARYQELVDDLREKGVRVTLKKMKGVV